MDNTKHRFSKTSKTLIALAISGLVACGGGETALDHLESAKRNHAENDLQSAIVELKNSLKKDAGSAEARALLGRIYSEKGLATDAEKELKKAIELGAPYNELALPLSSAMLMQGKADAVITEFAVTFSDREPTISIKSLALGESYFQKKDLPQAKKYLEAALENQQTRPRALLGQALISVVENKPDEAQRLVEKALKLDNNSLQAWMAQADIYRAKGELEAAESAYIEVAERSNGRSGYFYKLAMRHLIGLQLQRNDLEAADSTLSDLKKSFYKGQFPNDLQLTLLRSYLAYAKQDYEASSELANKVLQANKNLLGAKLVAGLSDARLDRLEQAETHLTSILLQAPEDEVARRALATIQLRLNNHDKTAETLEPFHQKLDELDSPTLALLAKAAYSSGKTKRSSDYLRKALSLEPDNSELSLLLARSLSAENKYDQAISVLKTIEKNADNSEQSLLSQAQVYIKAENYDAALNTLDLLQRENPSNLISSIKGTVYQLMGNPEKARAVFTDILESSPAFTAAVRSLAALELTSGQPDQAEAIYKAALSQQPENGAILLDYGYFLAQQQRTDLAIQQFQAASQIENYIVDGKVALARAYIASNQPEQAKAALIVHQGIDHSGVWAELGNAQMISEEFASALKSYNRLANLEPTSSTPHYLIATAYIALGELKPAKLALKKSIEVDGQFVPALSTYANLLIANDELEEAKVWLKKLEASSPKSTNLARFAGDIAAKEKRYTAATQHYSGAYALDPSKGIRQRLVQALIKSEGTTAAIEFLKKDVMDKPDNVHSRLLLANAYMNHNNIDAAIEAYKATLNIDGEQPIALNNLGWLLKDSAPEEALAYAERAHALKPENPDIKETLEQIQQILK